jgi:hypothetical protein
VLTTFFVYDTDDSIIGSINVPHEEAEDLAAHWRQPQASAAVTPKRMVNALLKSPSAPAPSRSKPEHPNPMVAAMGRNAAKNRLSKQAVLRCC